MVKANLKIDAGRESNSHSKYAVLNKCARIIADVILKATHANADREGGVARCPYARALSQSNTETCSPFLFVPLFFLLCFFPVPLLFFLVPLLLFRLPEQDRDINARFLCFKLAWPEAYGCMSRAWSERLSKKPNNLNMYLLSAEPVQWRYRQPNVLLGWACGVGLCVEIIEQIFL